MAIRKSEAEWEGSLREGHGKMKFGAGAFEGAYSYDSRFEDGPGTNPEELLAAAHAGCYSMSLSSNLGKAGFIPEKINTTATVHLERIEGRSKITKIELETTAIVPGIDLEKFLEIAEIVKLACPVSAALTGVDISLKAYLV